MLRLNFEPSSPPAELARDEAMLVWADGVVENRLSSGHAVHAVTTTESFRVWKFTKPTVILGRSSKVDEEVNRAFCDSAGIEVLRRCTGGASVVGGPGCLMYSVVIAAGDGADLRKIDVAHDYVMRRVLAAVRVQQPAADRLGICDLTIGGRKFSGNSLRVARHHLLYHGTILINADLDLIGRCLAFAPRQPDYRRGREHRDFVTNVPLDESVLIESLADQFDAVDSPDTEAVVGWVEGLAGELWASRYSDPQWHARR